MEPLLICQKVEKVSINQSSGNSSLNDILTPKKPTFSKIAYMIPQKMVFFQITL